MIRFEDVETVECWPSYARAGSQPLRALTVVDAPALISQRGLDLSQTCHKRPIDRAFICNKKLYTLSIGDSETS